MLSTNVKDTRDLMSIALQAEREAIKRYSQLAAKMREANNESAANLFERMVSEEQEHERLLLAWMSKDGIEENPEISPINWSDPRVSTSYNEEARDPHYSTPYRALAFAVHNEEIAFSYYIQVAAESENEDVRKYAEILAREELGHAALLRAERRRAYHAERQTSVAEPRLDPATIHNKTDLLTAAIYIDRLITDTILSLSEQYPDLNSLAKDTQAQIRRYESTLLKDEPPGEDITRNLQENASYNIQRRKTNDSVDVNRQRLLANCDHSFAFYDAIVESTSDESIMLTAQELTSAALDRLDILAEFNLR